MHILKTLKKLQIQICSKGYNKYFFNVNFFKIIMKSDIKINSVYNIIYIYLYKIM